MLRLTHTYRNRCLPRDGIMTRAFCASVRTARNPFEDHCEDESDLDCPESLPLESFFCAGYTFSRNLPVQPASPGTHARQCRRHGPPRRTSFPFTLANTASTGTCANANHFPRQPERIRLRHICRSRLSRRPGTGRYQPPRRLQSRRT